MRTTFGEVKDVKLKHRASMLTTLITVRHIPPRYPLLLVLHWGPEFLLRGNYDETYGVIYVIYEVIYEYM